MPVTHHAGVRKGQYQFDGPDWDKRSVHSKDFISRLLAMNPRKRPSADEALRHPWIAHEGDVPEAGSRRVVARIRLYSSHPWLKRLASAMVAADCLAASQLTREWVRSLLESYCPRFGQDLPGTDGTAVGAIPQLPSRPGTEQLPPLSAAAFTFGLGSGCGATMSASGGLTRDLFNLRKAQAVAKDANSSQTIERLQIPALSQVPVTGDPTLGMTLPELQAALRGKGLHFTDRECACMFSGLDVNSDGAVGLPEFAAAVLPRLNVLSEAPLLALFRRLDRDGDGLLSAADLTFATAGDVGKAQAAVTEADVDGDGLVSIGDFLSVVCGSEAHVL